jgi:hypothetical protein
MRTKQEVKAKLAESSDAVIVQICAALASDYDYIENATDGVRFQSTLELVSTRGEKGDLPSSWLQENYIDTILFGDPKPE